MAWASDFGRNHFLADLLKAAALPIGRLELVKLPADHVLCEAGQTVREVYFPISGMISTLAVSADGAEVEAVAVGREGIAGLPLVGQSDTSLFRVSVTLESKAFRMSFEHLTDLAGANDAIAARLDEYRLMTAAQVGRTLVCNSLHRIPQRSSRWLLAASQRTGRSVLPVTQDRISQLLGVRRPTVTDAIQGFVAKGFLEVVRGRIAIRNRAGLEEAACACLADELAQVTRSD